jgi:magnesium transporter
MKIVVYEGTKHYTEERANLQRLLDRNDDLVIWIDMVGPIPEDTRIMRETLRFHPLAIEQVLDHLQRPKVEEYSDHLFTIMNAAHISGHDVEFREVDIFVKHNMVVTVHRFEVPELDEVNRRLSETCALKGVSVGYILYELIHVLVDSYFPVLDKLERSAELLEDQMISRPTQDKLTRLLKMKRTAAEIWRISAQQRDMFSLLMRDESPYINQITLRYYLRNMYDHLLRIYDSANELRDSLSTSVDLFFSAQSQQLNFFINRLTLITIATGVLAVVTGFYGMNFEQTWPPFDTDWGVLYVVILIGVVLAVLLFALQRVNKK